MKDETGKKYGRLTVIKWDHTNPKRGAYWLCACDCGCMTVATGANLRNGKTKSCGCLKREAQAKLMDYHEQAREALIEFNKTFWTEENRAHNRKLSMIHGGKGTRLFRIWGHMKERCNATVGDHAKWYHDRGIRVCEEWEHSFETFRDWAYANGYKEQPKETPLKEKMSIDRIDPNKGYSPDNCRWISFSENSRLRNQYYANQR